MPLTYKFKPGDLVIPIAKTLGAYVGLSQSASWKNACKKGQPYLYVISASLDYDGSYICNSSGIMSGEYFAERDLIPYIGENEDFFDRLRPISELEV